MDESVQEDVTSVSPDPKPTSKFFTGEDGSLSTSKCILYISTLLICIWIIRDLYFQTALNWEHTILFIVLFLGSILNRIDTKRMSTRLRSLSLSSDGINVSLDSDPEIASKDKSSDDEPLISDPFPDRSHRQGPCV
jgi:hypothetical protein